jgi:hypothetical protein
MLHSWPHPIPWKGRGLELESRKYKKECAKRRAEVLICRCMDAHRKVLQLING